MFLVYLLLEKAISSCEIYSIKVYLLCLDSRLRSSFFILSVPRNFILFKACMHTLSGVSFGDFVLWYLYWDRLEEDEFDDELV